MHLRRLRRHGLNDAADARFEIAGQRVHLCDAGLAAALRGFLLGFQTVAFDHIGLEDLHRRSHLAQFVLAFDALDLGRQIVPGEFAHGIGHPADRRGDAGHEEEAGNGAEQGRDGQRGGDQVPGAVIGAMDGRGFVSRTLGLEVDQISQRGLEIVEICLHVAHEEFGSDADICLRGILIGAIGRDIGVPKRFGAIELLALFARSDGWLIFGKRGLNLRHNLRSKAFALG